jgi:ABC-type transport system involved in Fe-S cluster assembly fused permease/ATPase subunit
VPNPGRLLMSSKSSFNFNNRSTRTFCTKIKPAASTDSEEKLSKRDQKEKEMIDESTTTHKALIDDGKGKTSKLEIMKFIKPYLMSDGKRKLFYLAMGSMFLSKGLALGAPYCLKIAVNALAQAQTMNLNLAAMGVVGFGACRAFSSIFHEFRMSLVVKILRDAIQKLSLQIFSHLHMLDTTFHKTSTKNTIFAVNKALDAIDSGLRFAIGFVFPIALEFVLICGMLYFYCGPYYLLNIAVMLGVYTKFTQSYSKIRQIYIRDRRNEDKKAEFFLNESILSYDTVKYFGNENLEYNRYKRVQSEIYNIAMKVQYSLANINSGQQCLFALGMTVNLLLACSDISAGVLTPGDFVMIQALFMQIAGPLHFMGTIFRSLEESQVNVEDLFLILKMEKAVIEKPDAKDYVHEKGDIEFKKVRYSYEKDDNKDGKKIKETLFKNIDFKLHGGKSNAIVGPSGFGKTTIFNMLYRLMDSDSGEITFDGQNIKDLKIDSFRKRISIVPQNGILFNDTIRFNLQYGNLESSQEDIERV